MSLVQILEKDIPNPFGHGLVMRLNPEAFDHIEGTFQEENPYIELTWDDNGRFENVYCDVGLAVSLHSAILDLYEDEYIYYVVLPDEHKLFIYSKSNFTTVMKNIPSLFDLSVDGLSA